MTDEAPLVERAEEIVDVFTSGLEDDNRIGEYQFLVKRSDLLHLVVCSLEIATNRFLKLLRGEEKP